MDAVMTQGILDAGLDDWRKLAQGLHGRFLTGSFADGVRFAEAVGEGCAEVRLADTFVDVKLISQDAVYRDDDGAEHVFAWVTQRDIELARRISSIAQSMGIAAEPSAVRQLELALDTADLAAVGPFWAAVLTGSTESYESGNVVDPTGRVPNLWFQGTDAHETPQQRFHLDLWVPYDVAEERIAAGVAAGGRITYDKEAPAFTVLADPEGNKVCICTCLDR
ncbi:4a-hydroxytetrahydrobiopterin dehydratase [Kribbella steppae]|uniref:4a-hydroxytetrahydrobiopterin dehydratase n=1 Tax=Kribbella steppae TaxID=2512223 RepID=A0A4R2HH07_9ACTN|nr:VOC family protein [Kribbella steppae]TCO28464.1 4a-hydroxytetrahydrobiopterin dehydratase [Kribbella steppae]